MSVLCTHHAALLPLCTHHAALLSPTVYTREQLLSVKPSAPVSLLACVICGSVSTYPDSGAAEEEGENIKRSPSSTARPRMALQGQRQAVLTLQISFPSPLAGLDIPCRIGKDGGFIQRDRGLPSTKDQPSESRAMPRDLCKKNKKIKDV